MHHEHPWFSDFKGSSEAEECQAPAVCLLYLTGVAITVHITEFSDVKAYSSLFSQCALSTSQHLKLEQQLGCNVWKYSSVVVGKVCVLAPSALLQDRARKWLLPWREISCTSNQVKWRAVIARRPFSWSWPLQTSGHQSRVGEWLQQHSDSWLGAESWAECWVLCSCTLQDLNFGNWRKWCVDFLSNALSHTDLSRYVLRAS